MRAISYFVTAFLGAAVVSAQSSTTSSSSAETTCAAENILDACLATTTGYVSLCHSDDYICLCDKYNSIMTCFANCPSDARAATYESEKDLYCMNASIYGYTTGTPAPTSASSTADSSASATSDSGDSNSKSARKSSTATHNSSPLETGQAANLDAGGAVVAVFAAAGALAAAVL